jgi:hypothetical protein
VRHFYWSGKEALQVIDQAISRSNDTALNTQLQQIRDTFTQCEQTALQNLATALNITVPTTTRTTASG